MTSPAIPLTGAVILVTGATDGIGKQTAFVLARRGAKVIAHARTAERGAATLAEWRQRAPGGAAQPASSRRAPPCARAR